MSNRREEDYGNAGPSRSGGIWAAVLVVLALLAGLLVLHKSHKVALTSGATIATLPASDTSAAASTEVTNPASGVVTQTTLAATNTSRSAVRVIVVNGSGINKAGRKVNDALTPTGYAMIGARDAKTKNLADGVFYRVGFENSARDLATILGLPLDSILPVPQTESIKTPPAVPVFDVQVMVGPNLAAKYRGVIVSSPAPAGAVTPAAATSATVATTPLATSIGAVTSAAPIVVASSSAP